MAFSPARLFADPKADLRAGLVCLLIGIAFVMGYFAKDVAQVDRYGIHTVVPDTAYFEHRYKSDEVIVESGPLLYEIPYGLWKNRLDTDSFVAVLQRSDSILFWFRQSDSRFKQVRGLQAEGLSIDPAVGIDLDNSNRNGLLLGAFVFSAIGLPAVIHSMVRRRRRR